MKGTLSRVLGSLVAVAALGFGAGQAEAITYIGSGINSSSGNAISASADFSVVGGNLQVILTNTGGQTSVPSDVLTGLFFSTNLGTLTPVSALLSGSTVFYGPNGGGNVGGEWAYNGVLAGPHSATRGISTAGLGLFGQANFNGANLTGATAVQGLNYGIVSAADNIHAGNAAVTGGNPLIQNHVIFTLHSSSPLPLTLYASNFTNLSFQYGTALTEPNLVGQCRTGCTPPRVPEPSSMLLLGSGLVGLVAWKRRKAS